jgi:anti-anti-sigma factor
MILLQTAMHDGRVAPLIRVDMARREGVLTISLSGELDCATQTATRRALQESLEGRLPRRLIMDLAQLHFCDCAGARVLDDVRQMARERRVSCTIKDAQPQVRWVLQQVERAARPRRDGSRG